jgi:antirestriction protein ArdC
MTRPLGSDAAQDRLTAIHDQLASAVDQLASSEAWRAMLSVAARFHSYSPNNVLLIAAQRPDATRVAGYRAWAQLGRQVRKGEHGIAILAPVLRRAEPAAETGRLDRENSARPSRVLRGFRGTYVFDISQTDGPDLPEVRPSLLDGAAPLNLWADLLDQVEAAEYRFDYADLAPANGRTDFAEGTVTLHRDLPGAQKVKTLAHELAHVRLHAPDVRPEGCDRRRAEVEAESVAYIVTASHGVKADGYTVPYVTGWAGGDRELITSTATRVVSCARTILTYAQPATPTCAVVGRTLDRDRDPDLSRTLREPASPVRVVQR